MKSTSGELPITILEGPGVIPAYCWKAVNLVLIILGTWGRSDDAMRKLGVTCIFPMGFLTEVDEDPGEGPGCTVG